MRVKFELSTDSLKSLSPRRRWFLVALCTLLLSIALDALPGTPLPSIGILDGFLFFMSVVLLFILVAGKVVEDLGNKTKL